MRFNVKENDAISIVDLYGDRNSGRMVSEIATKEKELEMLREIISLRKTVHALVDSLIEVQQNAKDELEHEKRLSDERHRETMNRVRAVLVRDEGLDEKYVLARLTDDGLDSKLEWAFTFDGWEMVKWIMDWKGSTRVEDIPPELGGFQDSYIEELRDDATLDAIRKITEGNIKWAETRLEAQEEEMQNLVFEEIEPQCMDEAGVPTTFTRKCSICGEEGRNSRTHKDEPIMVDGRLTYHWI